MAKAFKIKDFPNYYITDAGDVYSRVVEKHNNPMGRIKRMKLMKNKWGYMQVGLRKNNHYCSKTVHRFVAQAFIPNPENKTQVNHIDGDKTNNNVNNLEWVTASENAQHKFKVLKYKNPGAPSKKIVQLKNNKVVAEYDGACDAHRKTGISQGNITSCCRGIRNNAGQYQWKYK